MKIGIEDVDHILADYYDEQFERNEVYAKKYVSKIIRELKERFENIKEKKIPKIALKEFEK